MICTSITVAGDLKIIRRGVADTSNNAPEMDRTSEADPPVLTSSDLEPDLSDDVHRA